MSDERTVVLLDGQNNVVGSITFASSTFLDVLTQMMVAGCRFEFSGGFVVSPSQSPKMVEARIVPLALRQAVAGSAEKA